MSVAPISLDDLELDALVELVNLGVSHAATALRDMIGEPVQLSVPNLSLVSRDEAVSILETREPRRLIAVHQQFDGDISGRALLIFPEENSLELVRAVVGGDLTLQEIVELEQEALAETGNIILNSCLGTIANQLERHLKTSLPQIIRGGGSDLMQANPTSLGDMVMFLYIDFAVQGRDLKGYIALLMDMPSLVILQRLLREFITRVTGETQSHVGA
jgi:chemotaxis protein CheC